ncbi:hypothetical protein A2476_04525 [candidate division CPR3 bacterium RIFOXYC2_FULL_35_7]|nr:MAG: hypothetical protein A2476_04525 [candidate division CPR3 bacterium RIFOXYC2_FULL_35_7]
MTDPAQENNQIPPSPEPMNTKPQEENNVDQDFHFSPNPLPQAEPKEQPEPQTVPESIVPPQMEDLNQTVIPNNPISQEELTSSEPIGFTAASMQQPNIETPSSIPTEPEKPIGLKNQGKKTQKILFIVAILIIVGVFSALGYFIYSYLINKKPPAKQITLTYWGLWESKENIQPIIDAYEKENPNVNINYEERSPEFYFETLASRLGKDTGPDIVRVHNTWIDPLSTKLSTVPGTIYDKETYEKTFYGTVSNTLEKDGSYYAIPLEYDGLALIYNETLFEQEGIKNPPKTWEEFREVAKKLTKFEEVEENGQKVQKISQAGAAFGFSNNITNFSDILGLLMAQNGVQFVDESGNITFDKTISPDGSNLGAEALSFYSLFSKETDLTWNKEWVSAHDAFVSGKLAMMFGPSWRVYNLLEANKNLKLKVATVPQIPLGDTQTTDINWATYWAEAVSKTAKDQATAWDFLKYMTQREQMVKVFTIASEKRIFGEPYSRQDLYSTLSSDPYLAPYVKSAKTATSFSMCDRTYDSIFNDEIVAIFKDEIIKINDGTLTAEAAIKDAADRVKVVYTNVVKK